MVWKKLIGLKREEEEAEEEEEEIDIDRYLSELDIREGKIIERDDITYVKPIDIEDETGIDVVINELKKSNIVVLNVRPLLHDKVLLRNIVDKLKEKCFELDGDIGRISEEKILIVPSGMRIIHRK